MSTHSCFAPLFSPFYTRLLRPDDGVQEPEDPEDDNTTTTLLYATLHPPVAARWWFPEDASLR